MGDRRPGTASAGRSRARREPDTVDFATAQWAENWPDLDVSPLAVLGRLHRTYLLYSQQLNDVFEKHGINLASFDVLATLRRSGPPYQMASRELALASLVSTGGVTLRVDRLEAAGLVERERDRDDRRVVYVRLTDAGLEKIHTVAREHFANEARLLEGLSAAERSSLGELLSTLERSIVAAGGAEPESDSA
ncbi:MarR family winged helix-turn-helix transcriptional regulator [Tsukamurella sp. 1534]|uniref:MarR family winged helix-turn-helix transcriptional regulator n=1 Tax=Tsukamurella sp. 1534 TaxID=1151061 RepID=UPI0002E2A5C2|nr:MarR family transcriptional regulator [Tsukamurella sp. 1534]